MDTENACLHMLLVQSLCTALCEGEGYGWRNGGSLPCCCSVPRTPIVGRCALLRMFNVEWFMPRGLSAMFSVTVTLCSAFHLS